ncbi:DUF5682 family protein [Chitinophaga silvatica]|uniref:DUF5682 family protein n=1 Tax=Chitinophaga silvatica TaxID=2282649 RepID=UPI0018F1DC7A|nr:DUF5682 family protein [Chitinophaga silvatica]
MSVHILGIRHHGPGSAKNVKAFLEELQPDIVLIEGPPEADSLLEWVANEQLQPPVAILAYQPDQPQRACFYPFATFSPEWQAMLYAKKKNIHVKFMDLPLAHVFGFENEEQQKNEKNEEEADTKTATQKENSEDTSEEYNNELAEITGSSAITGTQHENRTETSGGLIGELTKISEDSTQTGIQLENRTDTTDGLIDELTEITEDPIRIARQIDPISELATAAGFEDGERWWEHMFEYRRNPTEIFDAVHDAMGALRQELPSKNDHKEQLREAYMRKCIRQAEKEMFQRIAVICGAWHAPALSEMPSQKNDNELLKNLPKAKVACTWVPWTYSRLSYQSGYGAGIPSPGWYEHIWEFPEDDGTRWMATVAKLFREQQKDISVAHVIEAVRLANALAALRQFSRPGLEELNEATQSILCNGESIGMQLIQDEIIVRNRIGSVPAEIPAPPLQADILRLQKKLRLPATADFKDYTLDLRKDNDLERSIFLHRLGLLEIRWGSTYQVNGKGTFKEQWRLQWAPELSIDIIEKGNWGNTVEEAAAKFVSEKAKHSNTLKEVCKLLESAIPAELPAVVDTLIHCINNLAAASGDVLQLMEVIPSLVSISRYGNVRKTDAELVDAITYSMVDRICISLPGACTSVADDAAQSLLELFYSMNEAVGLLQKEALISSWQRTLTVIAGSAATTPAIAGYATRLLFDVKKIDEDTLTKAFSVAMSVANAPASAASWLEGFLKGSGTLLLLDETLWGMIYQWVAQLENDIFIQVLPLLRRTFSNFTTPERKKLGEKVKSGQVGSSDHFVATGTINETRGAKGIPVIMQLLGFSDPKFGLNGK